MERSTCGFAAFFGLALLDPNSVHQAWEYHCHELLDSGSLKQRLKQNSDIQTFRKIVAFAQYFQDTWLTDKNRTVEWWNMWQYDTLRTTNHCESWHSAIRHEFNTFHPRLVYYLLRFFNLFDNSHVPPWSQFTCSTMITIHMIHMFHHDIPVGFWSGCGGITWRYGYVLSNYGMVAPLALATRSTSTWINAWPTASKFFRISWLLELVRGATCAATCSR